MSPHLPRLKSKNSFFSTSLQSCSSCSQVSSSASFCDRYSSHRRDGRKGSLNQHRFLQSPGLFSDTEPFKIWLLPSQHCFTRSSWQALCVCCALSFFRMSIRTRPKWQGAGGIPLCSVPRHFPPVYGRKASQFWCEVNALSEFHIRFENAIM